MSTDVRQIFQSHHCYLEVAPYYIVTEDRPLEGGVTTRRVQVGFDLDIYGVRLCLNPDPPAEYWLVYNKVKEVAELLRRENNHACSVAVIPFGSTLVLDRSNYLQPMPLLRIRVTPNRDVHEPSGPAERQVLKAIEAQLIGLGVTAGRTVVWS